MLALVRMRMRMRGGAPACALTKRRNIEEEGAGARLFVRGADVTDNLAGRNSCTLDFHGISRAAA